MNKCSQCALITTEKDVCVQCEAKIIEIKLENSDDSHIVPVDYVTFTNEDATNIMNIALKGHTANSKC